MLYTDNGSKANQKVSVLDEGKWKLGDQKARAEGAGGGKTH